ncbi:MAG: AMP-binding protein [Nitriliruptorales bacterium]|nr:AMP-binding protein [Nitriliruptorales bacterium]
MNDLVTPGRRLTQLAAATPGKPAVIIGRVDGSSASLSYAGLEAAANRLARLLRDDHGVDENSFVVIGLPNSLEHVMAMQACWKLGACPTPIASNMPPAERAAMIDLARPAVVISDWEDQPGIRSADLTDLDHLDPSPLDIDPIPEPHKAIASGGSTGRPKLIVGTEPFAYESGHPVGWLMDIHTDSVVHAGGPLHHNMTFLFTAVALYLGATAVINDRFDARRCLAMIEEHAITFVMLVPTMMARMLDVDGKESFDLSSLERLMHGAAPCPDHVKEGWIDLLGPERVWEGWAATERTGATLIRGDEWLAHRGSVGRPQGTDIRILDEDGNELPPGEVGEIFSRTLSQQSNHRYLGADPVPTVAGGFESVGDLGWLDEDGYLYIADRRVDMVISGGANIFPAEVENALGSHPGVADVVVIGLPDEDLGRRVHAIVVPADPTSPPGTEALATHVQQRLAKYKTPRTWEFVDSLPRNEVGKLRRSALVAERS